MINLKKILCPTDFSDNSKTAQMYAFALAEQFGSELHLVHVIADPSYAIPPLGWGYIPESFLSDMRGLSDKELQKIQRLYVKHWKAYRLPTLYVTLKITIST